MNARADLAAQLADMAGSTPEHALAALNAASAGDPEPLRRYGVNVAPICNVVTEANKALEELVAEIAGRMP